MTEEYSTSEYLFTYCVMVRAERPIPSNRIFTILSISSAESLLPPSGLQLIIVHFCCHFSAADMCNDYFFLILTALTFPLALNLISSATRFGKQMLDVFGYVELFGVDDIANTAEVGG